MDQRNKKRAKNRSTKAANELLKEQCEKLNELIETGTNYKDVNRRMWKLKKLICGPKVGSSEPACINNPETGELITDKDTIKKLSLEHCAQLLDKIELSAFAIHALRSTAFTPEDVTKETDIATYTKSIAFFV